MLDFMTAKYLLRFVDIQTILLCVFLFLFVSWWMRQPRNLPPGPIRWPLVGSLPNLGISMYRSGLSPLKFITKLADDYGDVFSLYLGNQLVVIANSSQTVKEAFQNRFLTDRPQLKVGAAKDRTAADGVMWACGDAWKEQRRFTLSTFRNFGVGKRSFQDQISVEIRALCEEFAAFKGNSFDPRRFLSNAVSNIICSVIFGKRFEYSDTALHELVRLLDRQLQLAGSGMAVLLFPVLKYLNFAANVEKETHLISNQLNDYFQRIIESHQEEFDPADLRDYIDVYLNEIQQATGDSSLSLQVNVRNLRASILQLFAAGSETTTTTLRWALFYMIAYPDIQKTIQTEIDRVVGRNRLPNLSDKDYLPYTGATLMEVQRIASIAPLGVPHYASDDTLLSGYYIPKGTIVMANFWAVHHDQKAWVDPDVFRPERFLENGVLLEQSKHYLPFSVGPRVCLGENLAKMELFLFFTQLLHRFSFKKPLDSPNIPFDGVIAATNCPQPYELEAIFR